MLRLTAGCPRQLLQQPTCQREKVVYVTFRHCVPEPLQQQTVCQKRNVSAAGRGLAARASQHCHVTSSGAFNT